MDAITAVLGGHAPDLAAPGVAELAPLRGCPQTAAFHAEGDVAAHTGLTLARAAELAPTLDPAAAGGHGPLVLALGALLHDVGKPATTRQVGAGVYASTGHAEAGAQTASTLFATHPGLRTLPWAAYPAVHALVRDHMWTYGIDTVSPGALLRMSHLVDPALLAALWRADTTGRVCADAAALADQVGYAELAVAEVVDGPDCWGALGQVTDPTALDPVARRSVFRDVVTGAVRGTGAAAAALAAASRARRPGSLTYTIGLPGLGKSTWARSVWAPATGGVVLSAQGDRRRDRRAAAAAVRAALPGLLAAGAHVCVDATHVTRAARDPLLGLAGRYRVPVHAVLFEPDLPLALRRQSSRPAAAAVPAQAVRALAARLRWPSPDEYATLTVVDSRGRALPYTAATRWLTPAQREQAGALPPWAQAG